MDQKKVSSVSFPSPPGGPSENFNYGDYLTVEHLFHFIVIIGRNLLKKDRELMMVLDSIFNKSQFSFQWENHYKKDRLFHYRFPLVQNFHVILSKKPSIHSLMMVGLNIGIIEKITKRRFCIQTMIRKFVSGDICIIPLSRLFTSDNVNLILGLILEIAENK